MAAAAGNDLIADQLVSFCDELREEGIAIGTAEILDSFAAVEEVPWTDRAQFREALAATLAKSQEDRHLFDRVFDRWFFRAAELGAIERGEGADGEAGDGTPGMGEAGDGGERIDVEELAGAEREPLGAQLLAELQQAGGQARRAAGGGGARRPRLGH